MIHRQTRIRSESSRACKIETKRQQQSSSLGFSVVVFLCVALSACGFKLRGDIEVPETLQRVYLSSNQETATVKSIKRLLKGSGIQMVSTPDAAPYQLQILSESSERRAATLNSRAKTEEYELRSTLQFQVLSKDKKPILEPEVLVTEQVYTFDENNVNAKDAEEALLRREMRDDLARQLVRRYLGLAARKK